MINITIIGAGISGLYTAYKLISSGFKFNRLSIFEQSTRLGGRIFTKYNPAGYPVELGAWRFNRDHHSLFNTLIQKFELETIDFDYVPVLVTGTRSHLSNLSIQELAIKAGYDIFSHAELPLAEAHKILLQHPETAFLFEETSLNNLSVNRWKCLKNGLLSLIHKLYIMLKQHGVQIYYSHKLVHFSKEHDQFKLTFINNNRPISYVTNKLILALPKDALLSIQSSLILYQNINQAIATVPLFKMFLFFSSCWWENHGISGNQYIVAPFPLRRLYFSSSHRSIALYCDSTTANYWKDLLHQSDYRSQLVDSVLTELAKFFKVSVGYLPKIKKIYYRYWQHGVSFWKNDKNHNHDLHYIFFSDARVNELKENLFFISDMFSPHPGWIESALENVEVQLQSLIQN